jgi:UDP-GlcNAc:undecaprenyl-phosphate GlcNAc-1-phosphate transferase
MYLAILSFALSCVLTLLAVPLLARWIGPWLGLLDHPDENRKLHKMAIPMVGGLAVFSSMVLAVLAILVLSSSGLGFEPIRFKPGDSGQFIGFLIGASFLLLVGVVDDSIGLRGRQKLLGQVIAIAILIASGFNFEKMTWDTSIEFGTFSVIVVILWCLAVINSINLLDGADGFASTIGIVMSIALGVMAIKHPQGREFDAVIVLGLAGGLLGFLRYNFPPARVFLGDAGSMLIGFVLAAISIRCTLKTATTYAFFAPIALLAIPFIDTAAAILRRKLTGRSIYSVDRGHLHHSLMKRGFGPRVSLVWVALLCAATAAGGVLSFLTQQTGYALVSIGVVLLVMLFGRLFGVAEFALVSEKVLALGKSFVRRDPHTRRNDVHQTTVQLQGHRDWTDVWADFCEFSNEHQLNQITFDINLPWIHESYHGQQRRTDVKPGENSEWYAELPLVVDGKIFGRVQVSAARTCRFSHHDVVGNLLKLIADVEPALKRKAELELDDDLADQQPQLAKSAGPDSTNSNSFDATTSESNSQILDSSDSSPTKTANA